MEKKEIFKKKVNSMFLIRELYEITTFEGMDDTYSKNIGRLWMEIAIELSNVKGNNFSDVDIEILNVFKNTKYTDIETILAQIPTMKKKKLDIIKLLSL
ncbi:MAG: hypothetical protein ACRDDL_08040 [Sarcina sp.]